ncbi:MAG: hypothetical protein ACE5HF_06855 [Gemmatimonadota bacterium]
MSGHDAGGVSGQVADEIARDRALATVPGRLGARTLFLWLGAIAVGVAGFAAALGSAPQRAWQAVWVNFLFWTSIAEAGVVFGAILVAARGHWGKPFRRVAEGAASFLPISLLVFLGLSFGADRIFPWVGPVEEHVNRTWLTVDGVFWRNGVALAVLYVLSFAFLRLSLRPDAPLVAERLSGWRRRLVGGLARGWRGDEEEVERARRILNWLSPVLILTWVFVFSFLAIDLTLSLMPGFVSVVWGPLFFVAGWLCLLCLVAILAHRYRARYDLSDVWGRWEFHDLGKLMFAFVIFWSYLWWSQYLPIWYGNLGRETVFFEQRLSGGFRPLFIGQMALVFLLPFPLLLGRRPKMSSRHLALVGGIVLVGFWLERFLAVVPSTWHGAGVPLGWVEAAVTVGFVGLFGLGYSLFASTIPKLPIREALITGERTRGP